MAVDNLDVLHQGKWKNVKVKGSKGKSGGEQGMVGKGERAKGNGKFDGTCHNCGKHGHTAAGCWWAKGSSAKDGGRDTYKGGPGVRWQRERFLKGGMGFAAGVENAPGEAGYPC